MKETAGKKGRGADAGQKVEHTVLSSSPTARRAVDNFSENLVGEKKEWRERPSKDIVPGRGHS